jgi:hypothetical protein
MSWFRIPAVLLSLGALLACSSAVAAEPRDVVQQLYAEPNLAFGPDGGPQVFASDLEQALNARARGAGLVDFDYRYGFKDVEISGFNLLPQIDNDQAKVVAVFKNFGRPESVDWSLCKTAEGDWRIADASSVTGPEAWDLRKMLGLRSDQVSC